MAAELSQLAVETIEAALQQQWAHHRQPALVWIDAGNKLVSASAAARTLLKNALPAGLHTSALAQRKDMRRLERILSQAWISVSGGVQGASGSTATIRLRSHAPGIPRTILQVRFSAATHPAGRLLCCELADITEQQGQARLLRWLTWYFAGPAALMGGLQGDGADSINGKTAARHANFLRVMAMNSSNLFMVFDESGHCRYVTPSVERMLGYQPKELLGKTGHWLVLKEDWPLVEAAFIDALAQETGAVRRVECTVRHADGHQLVLSSELMHFGLAGQMHGIMGTFRDITGQRRVSDALVQSERRFSALMEHAQDVVSVIDANGSIRYVSPSVQRYLGYAPSDLIGRRFLDLVPAQERPAVAAALEILRSSNGAVGTAEPNPFKHRALGKDRSERVFSSIGCNRLDDPAVAGIIVNSRDVTSESLDGARRQQETERYSLYRERLIDLAVLRKVDWPASMHRILQVASETLNISRTNFWRLYSDPARMECEANFSQEGGLSADPEGWVIAREAHPAYFGWIGDNRPIVAQRVSQHAAWQTLRAAPRFTSVMSAIDMPVWVDGRMVGVLCFETESEERDWSADDQNFATHLSSLLALALESAMLRDAEKRIERLAWLDSLTGLPNRNLLRERLIKLLEVVAKRNSRMAVILMDLDRFKEVNDTYGHHVGDALLKNMAQNLHKTVGNDGWVARLGGDEFVVVVPRFAHRDELARLATRISDGLTQAEVPKGIEFSVTASMGIAVFPDHGRSISALLKHADAAMYQAKNSGRATFHFYNAFKHNVETREQRVAKQLQRALEGHELVLHYQPQVAIDSRLPTGFEALVRWNHPDRGLIFPEAFLSAIEEFGMAESLTKYVARQACRQIHEWQGKGLSVPPVSINITGREFCDLRLPSIIRAALAEYNLDPSVLVVEVTEGSLVHDNEVAVEVFKSLSQTGVHISLDDFGMGYSSLSYLRRLPLDSIKIDRSFIENLPGDADSAAIAQAIISMARHLNLGIVAEGVERSAQAEYLLRLGCKYAQGFLYSPALDVAGVENYLSQASAKTPTIVL